MFYFFVVISVESCEQNSKELEFSIVANWNLEERCNLSKMKDYSKDRPINFRIFYLSILPTKSNKQFQNNESEFSRFFFPRKQVLHFNSGSVICYCTIFSSETI